MKVRKVNWYGFIHEEVLKRYRVHEFINTFCVKGEYEPVAVYRNIDPDRSKGHCDFLLLQVVGGPNSKDQAVLVRWMNLKEMNFYRYQDAVLCLNCQEVVFMVMRHDSRICSCGSINVDGGPEYLQYGGALDLAQIVTFDFLTDGVIPEVSQIIN